MKAIVMTSFSGSESTVAPQTCDMCKLHLASAKEVASHQQTMHRPLYGKRSGTYSGFFRACLLCSLSVGTLICSDYPKYYSSQTGQTNHSVRHTDVLPCRQEKIAKKDTVKVWECGGQLKWHGLVC